MAIPPKYHKKRSKNFKIVKFLIIRTLGNFLILFSIFVVSVTFGPPLFYETRYQVTQFFAVDYEASQEPTVNNLSQIVDNRREYKTQPDLFTEILNGSREEILYPEDPSFSVIIPKIGANKKIVPNVDTNDKDVYLDVLTRSIAHAKGTAFPGVDGTTYLFAHSTDNFWSAGRFNAVFYLLNKMEVGDEITLFFSGKRYDYKVSETKIVESSDTHYVASNLGQGERVILQTCWPPGTAWRRLLVFATPVEVE
jgi:sortase A